MKKEEIIKIFDDLITGKRDNIIYSFGYKEFEETYQEYAKCFPYLEKVIIEKPYKKVMILNGEFK